MTVKQATCADRVKEHLDDRMEDLRALWNIYTEAECQKCGGEKK